ncbi:hypothetical protein [Azospira restricta]|uniref:Uncharacterized protein n=1 Tax=Azospira restricta TaxID=404405 RepID=A0A974Y553_9RHOO|nr:hypothetical protein [Azospira restricta]QRJ65085.1 hypothetical protein IWH25_07025 [Azospira restricta]
MIAGRERKLELAVVAVVLGILCYLLLNALSVVQREMEEATVQAEVSALRVELLDRLSHREGFGGGVPAGDNPVVWAGREPAGYVGEADDVRTGGVWYFRPRDGLLVYRFRAGDEWHFRLVRSARGGGVAILGGVGLVRVDSGQDRK